MPPAADTAFLVSDPQALLWFQVTNAEAGDAIRTDWYAPGGTLYQSSTLNAAVSGNQCFWDTLSIVGASTSMAGGWSVSVHWNNSLLISTFFRVSSAGTPEVIWQNTTTRQVTMHCYAPGPTDVGWAWLNSAGDPGWKVVGMADMDGNGVPDLIWQNDTTRQVTVNYYGGAGGRVYQGWAYLKGKGVEDMMWQNDTRKVITVNYYGIASGAVYYQGWAYLNSTGNPGWSAVGVADFDGNGTPDLVWQNDSTQQVTVNYYGGYAGKVYQGWAWLNSTGFAGWRALAAN